LLGVRRGYIANLEWGDLVREAKRDAMKQRPSLRVVR